LDDVVEILRRRPKRPAGGTDEPPNSLEQLPSYLRHAVAHFNIRPESKDEENLTHLLVWNRLPKNRGADANKVSFVARINVEKLRNLATHILGELSKSDVGDRYEATDPVAEFDQDWAD